MNREQIARQIEFGLYQTADMRDIVHVLNLFGRLVCTGDAAPLPDYSTPGIDPEAVTCAECQSLIGTIRAASLRMADAAEGTPLS